MRKYERVKMETETHATTSKEMRADTARTTRAGEAGAIDGAATVLVALSSGEC